MGFELNSSMKKVSNVQPHIYLRLLRNKVSGTNGVSVNTRVHSAAHSGQENSVLSFSPTAPRRERLPFSTYQFLQKEK